jgi:hypothetical protein
LLGLSDVFVITAGDMGLVPMIFDAGSRFRQPPSNDEMAQMATELEMQPLFT